MNRIFFVSALLFIGGLLTLSLADGREHLFFAKLVIFASLVVPVTAVVLQKTLGTVKSKALLVNLLLLGVSISVVLIIAEIFIRSLFADITTTGDNSSYFSIKWREENKPALNSFGFREREIPKLKPSGVFRIAVVGDSLTYGQGINEKDRFSRIIEGRLNDKKSGGYEVYNFGIPGAETADHIRFLDEVFKIDPDYILLQWFTNDVEGHDKSARPTYYRLIPSDYLSNVLHRNSALFYLIRRQWNAVQRQLGLVSYSYVDYMNSRFGDISTDDSQRSIRELNEFITSVKDKEIQLGIVMFPSFVAAEGGIEKYPFGYLFERVVDACSKYDIQCVDMRPEFAQEKPEELWVNRFDRHPSVLANQIAADKILRTFMNEW